MVKWSKHCDFDQYDLGSKLTFAILLFPWERHFMTDFFASALVKQFQTLVISVSKLKKKIKSFTWTAISWYLHKQIWVIACPMYNASVIFLLVRRINVEIK